MHAYIYIYAGSLDETKKPSQIRHTLTTVFYVLQKTVVDDALQYQTKKRQQRFRIKEPLARTTINNGL